MIKAARTSTNVQVPGELHLVAYMLVGPCAGSLGESWRATWRTGHCQHDHGCNVRSWRRTAHAPCMGLALRQRAIVRSCNARSTASSSVECTSQSALSHSAGYIPRNSVECLKQGRCEWKQPLPMAAYESMRSTASQHRISRHTLPAL